MPRAVPPVPRPPRPDRPGRAGSTARGYGTAHRKLRDKLLDLFPLCQVCNDAWSTDLHHVDGNPFNRAESNCLMVCEDCHHGRLHGGR